MRSITSRSLNRWLPAAALAALILAAGLASGCSSEPIAVAVRQPIAFPHEQHLAYFQTGQHRAEKIKMHLDLFGMTEPPEELAQGRCTECHDDLPTRSACAGCHVLFAQDAALRGRRDIRPCAGCHRGSWVGTVATIPNTASCLACHPEPALQAMREGRDPKAAVNLARLDTVSRQPGDAELPWVQINTVPANVYFSHTAHVRYAGVTCTRCHTDVNGLRTPPTSVRVVSMSECLACHAERGASTDCLTCHK